MAGVYEKVAVHTKNGQHKLQLFYNLHVATAVDTFFPMPESGRKYFGSCDFLYQMHLQSIQ